MGLIASLFNFGKQTQIKEQINYNGIQEDALIDFLHEFKDQISVDNNKLQVSIEKSVEKIIISKVRLIIAEIYKEHCESCSPNEKLVLSLEQIKAKANNMTSDIQKVISDLQETKNAAREIKSELNESRKQIEAEITSLNQICEDILYNVGLARKILGDKIDEVKELLKNYIKAAEKRQEETLRVIGTFAGERKNNEDVPVSSLDTTILVEMFAVIRGIKEKQDNGEDTKQIINDKTKEIQTSIDQMQSVIDSIKNSVEQSVCLDQKILEKVCRLYDVSLDTNVTVHKIKTELYDLRKEIDDKESQKTDAVVAGDSGQSIALQKELDSMHEKYKELENKLMSALSNGATSLCQCSYCGYKPSKEKPRMVVGGYCRCEICGKPFIDLNPDMSKISDEKVKADLSALLACDEKKKEADEITEKAKTWTEQHTAELEEVSTGVHSGLYRMKLGKYTVSSNGVLIIPNKTWDRKRDDSPNITEIAFCQPNTYDTEGVERLSKVRTLFLSEGIKLTEYGGEKPFSQIKGLKMIMRWDGDGYVEDEELYSRIKGAIS